AGRWPRPSGRRSRVRRCDASAISREVRRAVARSRHTTVRLQGDFKSSPGRPSHGRRSTTRYRTSVDGRTARDLPHERAPAGAPDRQPRTVGNLRVAHAYRRGTSGDLDALAAVSSTEAALDPAQLRLRLLIACDAHRSPSI